MPLCGFKECLFSFQFYILTLVRPLVTQTAWPRGRNWLKAEVEGQVTVAQLGCTALHTDKFSLLVQRITGTKASSKRLTVSYWTLNICLSGKLSHGDLCTAVRSFCTLFRQHGAYSPGRFGSKMMDERIFPVRSEVSYRILSASSRHALWSNHTS